MSLLYLCNGADSVRISDIKKWNLDSFLSNPAYEQKQKLVELGAYALMPNHFHLILQEIQPSGIALFMRKVCTGYSMYFNTKRHRSGTLLARPFKSKYIHDDAYLQLAVPYVLLNPAALFDSGWKHGEAVVAEIWERLQKYPYSSLPEFLGQERLERKIVGSVLPTYFERIPTLEVMLQNAQEYYQSNDSFLNPKPKYNDLESLED